jgi:hypothetical protein
MIDTFNTYELMHHQQVVLFFLASVVSMLYHYADRWLSGHERILTSTENMWAALKINIQLVMGSTAWTHLYDVSNSEIVMAGITIGFLAFSQGITKFVSK